MVQTPVEEPSVEQGAVAPWRNPTQVERPAFLMNFPFSYSTDFANNPWMTDLPEEKRRPDHRRAFVQFLQAYHHISAEGLDEGPPVVRAAFFLRQVGHPGV